MGGSWVLNALYYYNSLQICSHLWHCRTIDQFTINCNYTFAYLFGKFLNLRIQKLTKTKWWDPHVVILLTENIVCEAIRASDPP